MSTNRKKIDGLDDRSDPASAWSPLYGGAKWLVLLIPAAMLVWYGSRPNTAEWPELTDRGENRTMPLMAFEHETRLPAREPLEAEAVAAVILKDKDHGWSPLLWVVYLGFFFIDPIVSHASAKVWLLDGHRRRRLPRPLSRTLLASKIRTPSCTSAEWLLWACCSCPSTGAPARFLSSPRRCFRFVSRRRRRLPSGLATRRGDWRHRRPAPALRRLENCSIRRCFPVIIGAGIHFFAERNRMNRKLRKANEEIEHLAKVAERERIARDLHDVLGTHALRHHSEIGTGGQIDRSRSGTGGKRNPRSGRDFTPGSVRCARRDSRIPLARDWPPNWRRRNRRSRPPDSPCNAMPQPP